MKTDNLILNNYIPKEYLDKKIENNFSKKITQILQKIKKDIDNTNKTLNVLNKSYNFIFVCYEFHKIIKNITRIRILGIETHHIGSIWQWIKLSNL